MIHATEKHNIGQAGREVCGGRKGPGAALDRWAKGSLTGKLTFEQKPRVSERGSQDTLWGNSRLSTS